MSWCLNTVTLVTRHWFCFFLSFRAVVSPAKALIPAIRPLLGATLQSILLLVRKVFPHAEQGLKRKREQGAVYSLFYFQLFLFYFQTFLGTLKTLFLFFSIIIIIILANLLNKQLTTNAKATFFILYTY